MVEKSGQGMSPKVTWLSFTHFSLNPAYVVTDPVEIFFVVSWGMCCCLGWCLEPQKVHENARKATRIGCGYRRFGPFRASIEVFSALCCDRGRGPTGLAGASHAPALKASKRGLGSMKARLNSWFPWVFDGGEEFAELIPSWRQEREPFLPKAEMDTAAWRIAPRAPWP